MVIEIKNLTKVYLSGFWLSRVLGLKDLNLEIEVGETFGFLGPNGAGKTTTIKILTGLIKPTCGEARIFDAPVTDPLIRKKIGYLPEHPSFYVHLSGFELLNLYGQIFNLDGKLRKKRIGGLLERVGLAKDADLPIRSYSKGMVQRLGIAQSLINDPDLLIFDEPMEGLDPLGRKDIRDLFIELKKNGKTVFFSTHILSDVEVICDRVGIIVNGSLVSVGRIDDYLKERMKTVEMTVEGLETEAITLIAKDAINVDQAGDSVRFTFTEVDAVNNAVDTVREKNARVLSIIPHTISLEERFVEKVKER